MSAALQEENLAILLGGVNAGVIAAGVQSLAGVPFSSALPTALFGVGLPVAASGLGISYVEGLHKQDTMTALVTGGVSVGLMVLLGELPPQFDAQTLVLVLVCAAGSYTGNSLAHWFTHKDKN